jgi:hypothetical protein
MVNVGPLAESTLVEKNKNLPLVPSTASVHTNTANQAMNMPETEEMEPMEPLPSDPSLKSDPSLESRVSLYAENPSIIKNEKMLTPHNKLRGGSSLYSSMAQSAYTLAPAATLFGMASYLMSRRHGKASTHRKSHKKGGKSRRRGHRGQRRH